jgi:adenine-specific DNA-methyltransferase
MTDIKQNTTRNMTPMNEDLAVLRKHFPQCFVKDGDFDFEKFKQQLTTSEVDFYRESYGMDWLGKSYARLLACDEATTLLRITLTLSKL